MKINKRFFRDMLVSAVILCLSLAVSLGIEALVDMYFLVPAVFTLGVFLISFYTRGYVHGILASLISVIMVNYAFTFPYFKLNFSFGTNLLSAVIMLLITCMTSALTHKIKNHEKLKAESEKEMMRANLLRAVSHDLRTPLTTIYGACSMMIDHYDELPRDQILKLAEGMKEDADWLIGMVENLLSVTKIQGGPLSLKKEEVVLEELIDSVLVRFKRKYPNQNVEVELPDEFVSILVDPMLITQVLVNFLENAVRHAVGMDRLVLKVSLSEGNVVFEVIDNGCGVSEEYLDTIFTGYYEKKSMPVDNKKHCMGIGLSVCATVIKAHEGNIAVRNLKSGGCCFSFTLKREDVINEQ